MSCPAPAATHQGVIEMAYNRDVSPIAAIPMLAGLFLIASQGCTGERPPSKEPQPPISGGHGAGTLDPQNKQQLVLCAPWASQTPPNPPPKVPEPCKEDADCSSGNCVHGYCGPLRTGVLPNGEVCRADAHCESGFCDRGFCTDIGGRLNAGFGFPCKPEPSFAVREAQREQRRKEGKPDLLRIPACTGYICADGRCRSCVSDTECIDSEGAGTCASDPVIPGKTCGDHKPRDPNGPYVTPP